MSEQSAWMLQEVAGLGAPLFALFEHPAPRLLDGVALMMRAVAEGGVLAAAPMREAALAEGALLSHLLLATTQQVNHSHVVFTCSVQKLWDIKYKAPASEVHPELVSLLLVIGLCAHCAMLFMIGSTTPM